MKPSISVFVVCLNEEANIRRCLSSVAWCDELVVVDSGSSDRTLEIAREFKARIFERPWPGFVAQKRFGLEQCTSEWVMNLDADEEVSPELRAEIEHRLSSADGLNGFELNRVVFHLDRWWRKGGWYPEFRLRLLRRSAASWGGEDPHEKALVAGKTERLKGELRHYTYKDLADQVRALNSFSSVAAQTLFAKGFRAGYVDLFGRPIVRFIKFYLLKKGFLEGASGLIVAVLESCYVMLKYAKLMELERRSKPKS